MTNILVTGSSGQLGSEIIALSNDYKNYNFLFTKISNLDITNFSKVNSFVITNKIDVIINCAAYTHVDKAENDYELANLINNLAVKNLARISKRSNIKLIHISTDYVFDGKNYNSYKECDSPSPLNKYGKTKFDGELSIMKINPKNSIIIRTSWVYSTHGKNFVKSILKFSKEKKDLKVVSDQLGSPTYAKDLARLILDIIPEINSDDTELFHYSNEGIASWYDFAVEIKSLLDLNIKIIPINSNEFKSDANRPLCNILDKNKIKNKFRLEIPHWKESLDEMISNLK